MSETTLSLSPTDVLAEAREAHQGAVDAHHDAREASEAARATLAELEAAADRGEEVDTATFTTAKADLSLKSRRTAALAAQVAEADKAVDAAQEAVNAANIRELTKAIPSAEKAREKAREKALKAAREYALALTAEAEAVSVVHQAAKDLSLVDHTDPQGTGWATTAGTGLHGVVTLNRFNKLGWLRVDGQRVAVPNIGKHIADLAEEIGKMGHAHNRRR